MSDPAIPNIAEQLTTPVGQAITDDNRSTLDSPQSPPQVEAGKVPVVQNYKILGVLGRGGMGVVYKAKQEGLNRLVALKMVLAGEHAGAEELARFRLEAEAVAKLQHPNIVQVYEVGEADGRPFLSLEYVSGGSLAQKLHGTPMLSREAAQLTQTMAEAMHVAHASGIIHRDLKPANVLLTADGVPKITDFGLAKKLNQESGQTQSGTIMGTPSYMAPEQAAGRIRDLSPATDVYALGAVLYEMLTGRPPFRAATPFDTAMQVIEREPAPPRLLNSKVERELEAICLKCLEKDPKHRYASAEKLAEDLGCYLTGEPISIRSFNVLDRLARTLERSNLDVEFLSWGTMLLWFSVITLAEHLVVFALTRQGPPYPRIWISGARLTQFAIMGVIFWRTRRHNLLPTTAAERQLWSIWIGYIIASLIIGLVNRELTSNEALRDELTLYPMRSVLSGLAFFVMGGAYWGRCYTFAVAFFAFAALMPLRLHWAPLEFGLLWSTTLGLIGLQLRRLGKVSSQ